MRPASETTSPETTYPELKKSERKELEPVANKRGSLTQPNLSQLLLARSDWLSEALQQAVRASPYTFITPAQTRLLAIMAGKPMSMSEIARRLGVSRQAAHKAVNELERKGVLRVEDDIQRRNAKVVSYTELGQNLNRYGAGLIDSIESRITKKMGKDGLQQLKQLLSQPWD